MKLNETLLYIIATVQEYKKFLATKNHLEAITQTGEKGKMDFYKKTKEYYFNMDDDVLNSVGLKKNNFDFDRILMYKLTDEINNTEFYQLGKFEF